MTWLSHLLVSALAGSSIVAALPSYSPYTRRTGEELDAYSMHSRRDVVDTLLTRENWDKCPAPTKLVGKAPKENIWSGLTNEEVTAVLGYVHDPASGLNLTSYDKKGLWDNYVYLVEQVMPNKTEAVAYIDGDGPLPERYARVAISFGATETPYYEDWIVGPLPISDKTKVEPLTYYYNKGTSKQFNYRHDNSVRSKWKAQLCEEIQDITLDLLGTYINTTSATSGLQSIDPLWEEDGRIIEWAQFRLAPKDVGVHSVETLVPQGLYLKLDITGRDPAGWKLLGIYYGGIFYESAAAFRAAWEKSDFVRTEKTFVTQSMMTNRTGEILPYDYEAPPAQFQTQKRWTVDKENKYVKWMDFEFYIGFNKDVAVTLYDIKYKGERIFYELGLEEALAHYAGSDPKSSHTAFLDSYYGFGPYVYELVKGYDCPWNADYLDTSLHMNGNTTTNFDSICLFESDAGFPIQRHTTGKMATVTKNIVFNLRFVSTIGNYDYAFTYSFLLDGSIEVTVRASGYIQSTYYYGNEDYGYKIQKHLSGSMHDHVLTFKADLDIKGTKNSFETTSFVPTVESYPWSNGERSTMKVERSILKTEDDAKINWAPNGANMYAIINKDAPNVWGEYPGYRIMPGHGTPIHSTVQKSSIVKDSMHFATHHMYVTKQKDTERHLTHSTNNMDSGKPLVDFSKFFDGENLEQEDIVLWFNLGMHHLPHTGDLPITLMSTAQSSVVFSPHNYLLSDPTRQTVQQIEIDLTGEKPVVDNYGKKTDVCYTPRIVEDDYTQYEGGSTVSKMPHHVPCTNC
ncbi:copper amine oxidase [Coprinopsis cinerea okayama7|uniref:Amine oxidase n=1 Tax=Coprinopsis cinerea (strain Okayama-7 / 130 / ATCC MYA-4618 / FGSC 9003) TaxID=240176 RepID=A8P4E3_COPC7|nr:copper amine oxidase [Coprinopsis cinerea okayama7\|eukprot:XP_001838734.2 copper amine oxidase [Coprinopsis cinerea okayama7\